MRKYFQVFFILQHHPIFMLLTFMTILTFILTQGLQGLKLHIKNLIRLE